MRRPPQWRYRVAMKSSLRSIVARALLLILLVLRPLALHAQAPPKIFVASFGNDANDGSRGSPKRNFQAAHDAVAGGGQIVVLDMAGYGALNITKSVGVTVPPGVNGFVTVSGGSDGITINAGYGSVVSLRGLIIEGGGSNSGGTGVSLAEGTLYLDDCIVRNFAVGVFAGQGPPSSVAFVVARGTQVRNCVYGFLGNAANCGVGVILTECAVNGCSSFGVDAITSNVSNTFQQMTLTRCTLTANGTGIGSDGPFGTVYVDTCTLSNNATGLATQFSGKIVTRGNNTFTNNYGGNGAFTGTLSAQ
jgi:hypothetical protein